MTEPRVKTGLWVQAALRMGDLAGHPGMVLRKGDADAGGVLVVLHGRAGVQVLAQARAADGTPAWVRGTGDAPVDQPTADAYITRQTDRDPDLWVVEFETPDLTVPFAAKLV